jgi:hypothetical protein
MAPGWLASTCWGVGPLMLHLLFLLLQSTPVGDGSTFPKKGQKVTVHYTGGTHSSITVGGSSCACVPQQDSIWLHNEGGRKRKFDPLYTLPFRTDTFLTAAPVRSSVAVM